MKNLILSNHTAAPNASGATIGTLKLINASGTPSFSLLTDPSGKFEISGNTLKLKTGAALEAGEVTFAHAIQLRATDSADTIDQGFQIVRNDFLTNGVVAHRGTFEHSRGNGNSMTAFRDSIQRGFAHFECDHLFSQDDKIVVAHGANSGYDGGVPGNLPIATTLYKDLAKVSLGNGDYIPLLDEVLDLVMTQNRTRIVIELKNTPGGAKNIQLATAVSAMVRAKAAQAWVSYISFDYDMLLHILSEDEYAKCAPLQNDHSIQKYVADGMWGVDFNESYFTQQRIADLQSAGLTVNAWTVNNSSRLSQLKSWGIDLVTTDQPERLLALWDDTVPGQYHVSYKTKNGTVAINKINPDGFGTVEVWRGTLDQDITIVETFIQENQPYLFTYKSSGGKVEIHRIAKNGRGLTLVWSTNWSELWSSVQFFEFEGEVYHHSYKTGDGTVAINRVNPGGNGTTEVWRSSWSHDWSAFRFFRYSNGNVYHISYKTIDGTVAINQVNPGGIGTTEVWRSGWTEGWTDWSIFYVGTQPHLFISKTAKGNVHIDRFNPNGLGTENIWSTRWSLGWTDMEFFTLSDRWHHLSLKIVPGTVALNEVNALGIGTTEVWEGDWSNDWSHLRVFQVTI